jgi:hypothetical protein
VGGRAHHQLQRLRPSGAPTGAALPLARPSTVPARPIPDVLRGSSQPLAAPLKLEMEARLGADFSDVRVHTDNAARASAAEVGARAYTSGSHVVIGEARADKLTLAHELTHVIQQRQGPVAGTDHGNGVKVSDPSDVYEQAAEANASHVMATGTAGPGPANRWDRPLRRAVSGATAERFARPLPAISVQRLPLVNADDMDPGGAWVPTVDGKGRATRVDATNLKLKVGPVPPAKQVAIFTGLNEPDGAAPPGWTYLRNKNLVGGPPGYRRMHLLNGNLGGPGNDKSNLVPGSASLNSNHFHQFEGPAMLELSYGLTLDTYWVQVWYNAPSNSLQTQGAKDAWQNTVKEIWGGFTYTDAKGTNHNPSYKAVEEPNLDSNLNWLGH